MYKLVLIAMLVVSVVALTTVIPSTAQAYYYGPGWGYGGYSWGSYPVYGYGYGYGYGCGSGCSSRGFGSSFGGFFKGFGFGAKSRGCYGGYFY